MTPSGPAQESKISVASGLLEPIVLQPGQVIQNYEILKPLGKGKFSIVYAAKHLSDGQMCALKKINIFDMMVPKQREKCLKEVDLLRSLDHPNIVKLLDSFVDRSDLLIIVEWAERGDLKRLIRKALANESSFSGPEIWEYSRQLAGALDHMHSKRIMHRDLKPANIFVTVDGMLKLGDLGLGRLFSSQTLEAFSKVGTPLYMSPEVLHGAGYDMRSDVWSLGCVIYELAMLRSPFKSEQQLSLYDLFVRISKGQYSPLPETFCAALRGLVVQMLHLDPTKRLDMSQVYQVCTAQAAVAAQQDGVEQRTGPSPLLVMDDIVEKLKLLDCEEKLLRPRGFPLLHRCFFALQFELPAGVSQFDVMFELIHWLLDLRGRSVSLSGDASAGPDSCQGATCIVRAGDAAAGGGQNWPEAAEKKDRTALVSVLLAKLKEREIQAADEQARAQLVQGWGDAVCYIVNELINQELIGREFHFKAPWWDAAPAEDHFRDQEDPASEVDEEIEDGDTTNQRTDLEEEEEGALAFGRECIGQDRTLGLEPIHIAAAVDRDLWAKEVERAQAALGAGARPPGEACSWHASLSSARLLARNSLAILQRGVATASAQQPLVDAIGQCRAKWCQELRRLTGLEDRLGLIGGSCGRTVGQELRDLQAAAAAQLAQLGCLRGSVDNLSNELRQLQQELERLQQETADRSEELQSSAMLLAMRRAVAKLRLEDSQLNVNIGVLHGRLGVLQKTRRC